MSKTKGDVLALYWKISYTFMIMNSASKHSDDLSILQKGLIKRQVEEGPHMAILKICNNILLKYINIYKYLYIYK